MYEAQGGPLPRRAQPAWYQQGHIPGARSLPSDDFERRYLDMMEVLEAAPVLVVYSREPRTAVRRWRRWGG